MVLDARAGRPVSFNREARRIVERLRTAGRPAEHLLEVVSVRRADGREVSPAEIALEQQLGAGETVRGEEVVLSVADGRSVRTLINATPIRADGGGVGSVVVTMQDLAPLDEIERMRTEFLILVSHELRAPLVAIKGSADALLEEAADLDPAEMREFHRIIAEQATPHARPRRRRPRGRIRAESPGAGRGATFTFALPAAGEAGAAAAHARTPPPAPEPGAPSRVLVVDDDPRALRFVRDALSGAGYAPLVTGAPRELQRIIRTERPPLVLLDLMLPDVDGIELMRQVPELADLPVIFISGYGRDKTVAKALDAGAADYMVKAVPGDRTRGPGPGGAAAPRGAPTVRGRRACHRLRAAPGDGRRRPGRAHRHRVRAAARALCRRGAGRERTLVPGCCSARALHRSVLPPRPLALRCLLSPRRCRRA